MSNSLATAFNEAGVQTWKPIYSHDKFRFPEFIHSDRPYLEDGVYHFCKDGKRVFSIHSSQVVEIREGS